MAENKEPSLMDSLITHAKGGFEGLIAGWTGAKDLGVDGMFEKGAAALTMGTLGFTGVMSNDTMKMVAIATSATLLIETAEKSLGMGDSMMGKVAAIGLGIATAWAVNKYHLMDKIPGLGKILGSPAEQPAH